MSNLTGGSLVDANYYCQSIRDIARLTKEQEIALGQRVKNDPQDEEARQLLVRHNLGIPIEIAKRYVGCGLSFSDLIQEGNLGLIRAVQTYNPDKNVRFGTYAFYVVRHSIYRAISQTSRLVRVPYRTRVMSSNIRKDRMPTKKALDTRMKHLGMSSIKEFAHLSTYREVSIDKETQIGYGSHGGKTRLADKLSDPSSLSAFQHVDDQEQLDKMKSALDDVLALLKPKDREILELFYGLNGQPAITMREIAPRFGCTFQNIYARYVKAMAKLKSRKNRITKYA